MNWIQVFVWSFLLFHVQDASAQRREKDQSIDHRSPKQELSFENKNYLPQIQSVQILKNGEETSFPIIEIDQPEQLMVSFDDLRADIRNYYYSIIHCDKDWKPSRASLLDYSVGYNEDRIVEIASSQSTVQPYTNYRFTFPNEYIGPKIAGNYLLLIYEDSEKDRLVATVKFYAVNKLVHISASTIPSPMANTRNTHQKINVRLSTDLTIDNPHRDVQVVIFQNRREDTKIVENTPSFVSQNNIRYDNNQTFNFPGNNEFRYVDLRTLDAPSTHVQHIMRDTNVMATVKTDAILTNTPYSSTFDNNGAFFIQNTDRTDYPHTTSDYAQTKFSLDAPQNIPGKLYIVGDFNKFVRHQENQLEFDSKSNRWTVTLPLKQGLYDYTYILEKPDGTLDSEFFSGSHSATENTYQILVYARRIGTYWDELLGFEEIQINNNRK